MVTVIPPPDVPILVGDFVSIHSSHQEPCKAIVTDVASGQCYEALDGVPIQVKVTALTNRRFEHGSVHSHAPNLLQFRRRAR